MNNTAPETIPIMARTVQAHTASHPALLSPDAHLLSLTDPVCPQQGSTAGKRMFRRSIAASESTEGEEGGNGQQQGATLKAQPLDRRPLAERVAAVPPARLQRWLSNAVRMPPQVCDQVSLCGAFAAQCQAKYFDFRSHILHLSQRPRFQRKAGPTPDPLISITLSEACETSLCLTPPLRSIDSSHGIVMDAITSAILPEMHQPSVPVFSCYCS